MRGGGIFDAPSSLGTDEMPLMDCNFLRNSGKEAPKTIQAITRDFGATRLKTPDGDWGHCSERAFRAVFGEPLTEDFLLRSGLMACKPGSFRKTAGVGEQKCTAKDPKGVTIDTVERSLFSDKSDGDGTPAAVAPAAMPVSPALLQVSRPFTGLMLSALATPAAAPKDAAPGARTTSSPAAATLVAGVPNWVLAAGAAVAVIGAAAAWRYA